MADEKRTNYADWLKKMQTAKPGDVIELECEYTPESVYGAEFLKLPTHFFGVPVQVVGFNNLELKLKVMGAPELLPLDEGDC